MCRFLSNISAIFHHPRFHLSKVNKVFRLSYVCQYSLEVETLLHPFFSILLISFFLFFQVYKIFFLLFFNNYDKNRCKKSIGYHRILSQRNQLTIFCVDRRVLRRPWGYPNLSLSVRNAHPWAPASIRISLDGPYTMDRIKITQIW